MIAVDEFLLTCGLSESTNGDIKETSLMDVKNVDTGQLVFPRYIPTKSFIIR